MPKAMLVYTIRLKVSEPVEVGVVESHVASIPHGIEAEVVSFKVAREKRASKSQASVRA